MSTSSSKRGQGKRRSRKVRVYGGIRGTQLTEEKAAMPKTLAAQAYFGGGMWAAEEDPAIANIIVQTRVDAQRQLAQASEGDKSQTVGVIIDSTGRTIRAVKTRLYLRKAFSTVRSQSSSRKVRTLRSRLRQLVPDAPPQASRFESLLESLRSGLDTPTREAIDAVLEIQITPIPEGDLEETIQLLVSFIKKYRGTNSQKLLIAVGAAIRKVLLNLPAVDLGLAVDLMKSEGSLTVPIGVELEVAKMVVQRVVEDPSVKASDFPQLADALYCNAKIYSTAQMVNRELYNATALNSVLACLLMQHPGSQSLSSQIFRDSPTWFSKLCSNRLKRICTKLLTKKDSNSQDLVNHLNSLLFLADGDQKSQGRSGS